MKKSEKNTPTLVIICITILIAAYGISLSIYEIRASRVQAAESKILSKKIQDDRAADSNIEEQNVNVPVRTNRQRNSDTNASNSAGTRQMDRGTQNITGRNANRTLTGGRRGSGQNPTNTYGADTSEEFAYYGGQDAFYGPGPGFGGIGFGGQEFADPGFGDTGGMDEYVDFSQYDDSGDFYDQSAEEVPDAFIEQGNEEELNYDYQNDFGGMPDYGDAGMEEYIEF